MHHNLYNLEDAGFVFVKRLLITSNTYNLTKDETIRLFVYLETSSKVMSTF